MSDLQHVFDALYSRLLLRDFFGKIVPGMIVLVTISLAVFPSNDVLMFCNKVKFFPALILIGLAWIMAFAIQAIGEKTRLIRYHTYKKNEEFYTIRFQFHKETEPEERQELERLIVIKEACGNCYVALLFCTAFSCLNVLKMKGLKYMVIKLIMHWPVVAVVVIIIVFLAIMHFIHVSRQDEYMRTILKASKEPVGSGPAF